MDIRGSAPEMVEFSERFPHEAVAWDRDVPPDHPWKGPLHLTIPHEYYLRSSFPDSHIWITDGDGSMFIWLGDRWVNSREYKYSDDPTIPK